MLYRIEGTGVRIAGTASALTLEKPHLPPWVRSAFERSDRLIFEADIETLDPAAELLPVNQSLTVLSFFGLVASLWQQLQLPERASRFKVWAANARLSASLSKLVSPGVEALLLPEAKCGPSPPQFLETPQERIAVLDAVPLDEQLARLEHLATQPEEAVAFEVAMHAAWLTQNIDAISRLVDSQRKTYPETFAHLLDQRHRRWLPRLIQMLDIGNASNRMRPTLIAVEAAHLCGERGMVSLLSKEGYTLTRLL